MYSLLICIIHKFMLEQHQQTSVPAESNWTVFGINACALATCMDSKTQIARISVVIFPPTYPLSCSPGIFTTLELYLYITITPVFLSLY